MNSGKVCIIEFTLCYPRKEPKVAVAEKAENTGSIHYKDLQPKPEGATTAAFVPIIVKINYANLKPLKQRLGLCSLTRSDRVRRITPSWFHGVDEAHTHTNAP